MELSMRDLKELVVQDSHDDGGFTKGTAVFIRTVTHYYLGKVADVGPTHVVLSDASWVADTGLFSEMLKTGVLNEVEPYQDDVVVSRGAIVDFTSWRHPLPRERK